MNHETIYNYLHTHQWPRDMSQYFVESLHDFAMRYFICDDSGSMYINDGEQIKRYPEPNNIRCSRWSELTTSMTFHAQLAYYCNIPAEFRLMNRASPIRFEKGQDMTALNAFLKECEKAPNGATPLCRHIFEITQEIRSMEAKLLREQQLVHVTIATDGEASDGDIYEALRPLTMLPVKILIRLCTSEEKVVNFWNKVKEDIENRIDVLDDLRSQSVQVSHHNSSLTYGEPIHRMREFGMSTNLFQIMDSVELSPEYFSTFCELIYGKEKVRHLIPAECNMAKFLDQLEELHNNHDDPRSLQTFCVQNNIMKNWVSLKQARYIYLERRHKKVPVEPEPQSSWFLWIVVVVMCIAIYINI